MKTIFVCLVVVLSGLFLYEPKQDYPITEAKRTVLAPELKECQMYKEKIKQNIRQANEKRY